MKIFKKFINYYKRYQSKMTKPFRKYLIISMCIILLTTSFLYFTGNEHVFNFVGFVMLFNLGLAYNLLGKPTNDTDNSKDNEQQ